jgi:tetratricopeptide (TPR) repeat protein
MDIETLKTELDLLLVIHDQQHYQRVRERLEQIQNICQETLGIEAPLTLRSRWQLAEILNHLGEHRKAVEICEHDLPICLEVLPDNDQTTLRMISNLAAGERSLGDKQHAERSLLALIPRVRDAIGGDDNPAMIRILRSLGRTVALQNRHAEAERWFQRVLALQQKVLGNHHPDIFETRIDIAASHFLQGDRDAAITMIRTIADEQAEVLGADDPRTLTTRQKLALLLSQHDGPNQAIEEYEKLVPLVRATLDPEHPTRTAVIDWYGKSLEQVGRHDAFEVLLRKELKAQNQALGPEHMATRRTVSTLREMFERNDDPDAATGLLQRQIDVLKEDRFRADPFDRALLLAQYCAQAGLVSAQHDRLEEAILYWTEESKWRELADQLKPGNLDNLAGWGGSLSNMAQARLRASENTLTPAELEDCLTQLESAEQKLAVVLAAEPTHVVATKFLKITTRNLAKTCVESDRFELAAEYFKSLAELTTGTDRIKNIRNQVNALIRANRLDAAHDLLENGFEKLDISDDDRLFMAGAYARCLQANRTNSETSVQFPAHPQPLFRQSAMALLKKLVADRDKLDPRIIAKLRWGDEFNSLREDEEFISLLAQLPTENKAETEAHIPGQH